jgi:rhodanese-related sulfurtransferase
MNTPPTIHASELQQLMTGSTEWALLDVREAGEADGGHILGTTFLPRRMLELKLPELVPDRRTAVIVYDEGGERAPLAARALHAAGYTDARVLAGGIRAWADAGFGVSSGSNVPSKLFGERVYEHEHVPQLPVATLHEWQRTGKPHLVLDIRTPDEYEVGHIPGARGAFGVDVGLLAGDLRARGQPVVVHCAGRTRSIIACQSLRELGIPEVYALENGTMGWLLAGHELERATPDGVLTASPASVADATGRARALATGVGVDAIDAAQLERWLEQRRANALNLYVFDVRQVQEYEAGHVPGARALPGGLAIQRTDEFIAVRHAHVVLVDDGNARAWMTAYWLRRLGLTRVHVLAGGLASWRGALETGRPRPAPIGLRERRERARFVAPAALAELLAGATRPVVVDVDTSKQFASGHVPGAQWLPYGWLEARIAQVAPDGGQAIVLTCHNGVHSTYAAANLAALGYTDVRVLEGGVAQWKKAGQALERGLDAKADDIVVPPYQSDRATMARYLEWEQKLTKT